MKFGLFLFIYFLLAISSSFAQLTYSGNVLDATDKTYLEGIIVEIIGKDDKVLTNNRGYFSITAEVGDTLKLSFPGFIESKKILEKERYLQLQIQDKARLLPTFEVKSEANIFRFKDGKLVLIDPDEEKAPSKKGGISAGYLDSPNGTGGVAIAGVLSSLTKRAKQERAYQKKLEWDSRRAGYYAVIESDSVRQNLMVKYQLERADWDRMIIRFNEGNAYHEFLDWSKERVYAKLSEFIERERSWGN